MELWGGPEWMDSCAQQQALYPFNREHDDRFRRLVKMWFRGDNLTVLNRKFGHGIMREHMGHRQSAWLPTKRKIHTMSQANSDSGHNHAMP